MNHLVREFRKYLNEIFSNMDREAERGAAVLMDKVAARFEAEVKRAQDMERRTRDKGRRIKTAQQQRIDARDRNERIKALEERMTQVELLLGAKR